MDAVDEELAVLRTARQLPGAPRQPWYNMAMSAHLLSDAARLSDRQLSAQIKDLAHRERSATAVLIAHLAVLDERRLYLAEGCSSLFAYCVEILHLSEHATYNRIETARAARKYPIILDRLAAGDVHLTAVRLLAPHLTPENYVALLDEARHLRTREIEEIVARLQPKPPVPSSVRRLPLPRQDDTACAGDVGQTAASNSEPEPSLTRGAAAAPSAPLLCPLPAARRPVVEPLAPRQYRVQFTADADTRRDLEMAQDLLRHQIPDGDVGKVISVALRTLVSALRKQKYGAADRPPTARGAGRGAPGTRSRYISAAVRREVWKRDAGQCAFVGESGRRCSARSFLEFHHLEPYALGGGAAVENIQLRCRAHNGYEAEQYRTGLVLKRVPN